MDIRTTSTGGQAISQSNAGIGRSNTNISRGEQQVQVSNVSKDSQQSAAHKTDGDYKEVTEKEVGKAVDKLNKLLEDKETHAEYEIYGRLRQLTVRIVNNNTKEVVQEIPPRKIIDMVDKLCELAGIFVDKKV
jgi:flagellar protein FlaG